MKFIASVWFALSIITSNMNSIPAVDNASKEKEHSDNAALALPKELSVNWDDRNDQELADIFHRMHGDRDKIQAELIRLHPELCNIGPETLRKLVVRLSHKNMISLDRRTMSEWRSPKHRWTYSEELSLMRIWHDNYKGNLRRDLPLILREWKHENQVKHDMDIDRLRVKINSLLVHGFPIKLLHPGGGSVIIDDTMKKIRDKEEKFRQRRSKFEKYKLNSPSEWPKQRRIPQKHINETVHHHGYSNYSDYLPRQHHKYVGQGSYLDPLAAHGHPIDPQSLVNEHHTFHASSSNPSHSQDYYIPEPIQNSKASWNQGYHSQAYSDLSTHSQLPIPIHDYHSDLSMSSNSALAMHDNRSDQWMSSQHHLNYNYPFSSQNHSYGHRMNNVGESSHSTSLPSIQQESQHYLQPSYESQVSLGFENHLQTSGGYLQPKTVSSSHSQNFNDSEYSRFNISTSDTNYLFDKPNYSP